MMVLERLDSWAFPGQTDEAGLNINPVREKEELLHHIIMSTSWEDCPEYKDNLTWNVGRRMDIQMVTPWYLCPLYQNAVTDLLTFVSTMLIGTI